MSLSGVIGGHRWPQLKPLCRDCTRHHLFKISAQNVPLFLSNHFVNLTVKEAEKTTETWKRESRGWVLQQVLVSSRAEYAFNMSASAFVNLGHLALRFSTQHNFILHFVLI